jgi:hypothetical protein
LIFWVYPRARKSCAPPPDPYLTENGPKLTRILLIKRAERPSDFL